MQTDIAELVRERRWAAEQIDEQVAAETPCPRCGAVGSRYEAHYENGQYSAVSVCRKCGLRIEF